MSARPMVLHLYRTTRLEVTYLSVDGQTQRTEAQVPDGWRWRIRATNGRIIADSAEAYGRLRDCARGAGLATGLDGTSGTALDVYVMSFTLRRFGREALQPWRVRVDA